MNIWQAGSFFVHSEVTGGSDGDQVLSSGEVFNPRLETWQDMGSEALCVSLCQ